MSDTSTPRTPTTVHLRPATADDAQRLFDWRGHPSVRAQSGTSAELEWDTHVAWLSRVLVDADTLLRIGLDETGNPVGMVRADRADCDAVYSVIVDPQARGGGVGSAMMLALEPEIAQAWPQVTTLCATVMAGNVPSHKMMRSVGMQAVSTRFEKTLDRGQPA